MTLTTRIAAAGLAAAALLMAGCSAGGPTNDSGTSGSHSGGSSGSTAVPAPAITAQPADASAVTATTATFKVTATGTGVRYQWKRNGSDIAGAVAASFTTPAVGWADEGAKYTVVVTNSSGSVTSAAATLHLALSADQAAFESFALADNGGVYSFDWHLSYTGAIASDNFLSSSFASYVNSPLTAGPVTVTQSAPENLAPSLALPHETPSRLLVDGKIVIVPPQQNDLRVTYVGSAIQVDDLTSDATPVVAYSQVRTNYAVHALTGAIGATPSELALPLNSVMYNPLVLDHAATWAAGSAYLTYTATAKTDRYIAFDCFTATYDANVDPCFTNTTLAARLAAGIHSNSDNITYTAASGTTTTISGVPVFVATNPRPQFSVNAYTVEYRIYFELNGNVYTGSLIKDGTVFGGGRYLEDPTASVQVIKYVDYQVRLNKAARDSLAAASLL